MTSIDLKFFVAGEAGLTVYQAEHDGVELRLYTSRKAARTHCETELRREVGDGVLLTWVPDHVTGDATQDHDRDDMAEELYTGASFGCTGYAVVPVPVASRYDPTADD